MHAARIDQSIQLGLANKKKSIKLETFGYKKIYP